MKNFKLDEHHKISPGFSVPNDYFNEFPARVMNLIADESVPVIPIHRRPSMGSLMKVAAVLLLALMLPMLNAIKSASTSDTELSAMEAYLDLHPEIASEQIAEQLDANDIDNISVNYHLADSTIEDVLSVNPDVEQYLIN